MPDSTVNSFHDDWHDVASLKPKLKSSITIHRQIWRSKLRYVIYDCFSDKHFFLEESAHFMIINLNKKNTIDELWEEMNGLYGDLSLTQSEVIELLTQLFNNELISVDSHVNSAELFQNNRQEKHQAQFKSVQNFLFTRIPLGSPDKIIEAFYPLLSVLFKVTAFLLVLSCAFTAIYQLINAQALLKSDSQNSFEIHNLFFLYLVTISLKLFHEIGHGVACKYFLKQNAQEHSINNCGILFMLLLPFPFIDLSQSWKLKSKTQRMIIGLSGMYFEFILAILAIFIYLNTVQNTLIHALAFNAMISASLSSLLFNANPFLRYDAYYVLSDYLEIPNLMENSKTFFRATLKKLFFGIKLRQPSYSHSEKCILITYAILSSLVRCILIISIIFIVATYLGNYSSELAIISIIIYLSPSVYRLFKYFFYSSELEGSRSRSSLVAVLMITMIYIFLVSINFQSFTILEAQAFAKEKQILILKDEAFIQSSLEDGSLVKKGQSIVDTSSQELKLELSSLRSQKKSFQLRKSLALKSKDYQKIQIYRLKTQALNDKIDLLETRLDALNLRADFDGILQANNLQARQGNHLSANTIIGQIVNPKKLYLKAFISQEGLEQYSSAKTKEILIRFPGDTKKSFKGQIIDLKPAAIQQTNRTSSEKYFEIEILPEQKLATRLLLGQSLQVKIQYPAQALWFTIKHEVAVLFQRKFKL